MGADQLKQRTQAFGLSIVKFVEALPNRVSVRTISQQLIRSGTSVGANFRSACRARSHADFIAKPKIVEEECDESIYWLEILIGMNLNAAGSITRLIDEGNQILSIVVASINTARHNSSFVTRNS